VRVRRLPLLTTVVLLAGAPAASADTSASSNWAGYAAHRSHGQFGRVFASWTQPSLSCTPGQTTYSALWVGLGGYRVRSKALEQVGTEADCRASGATKMSAWYELVPSPSRHLTLAVRAGDRIAASVTVTGHLVTIRIRNLTTDRAVRREIRASQVDVSSAEWIGEAPSACVGGQGCRPLPLADFGSATFHRAGAQLAGARKAAISDRHWILTKITLRPGPPRFVGLHPGASTDEVIPSALADNGTAFTLTYSALTPAGTPPAAASDASSATLFHLGHR
jgi:hypothetical protein